MTEPEFYNKDGTKAVPQTSSDLSEHNKLMKDYNERVKTLTRYIKVFGFFSLSAVYVLIAILVWTIFKVIKDDVLNNIVFACL